MRSWLPCAAFLAIVSVNLSAANTYVIRPDGTGDFAAIQGAITASGTCDVVELTDVTFRGDGNRDLNTVSIIGPFDLTIQGITITSGFAYRGGAVYCYGSAPLFQNCIFTKNTVE
jgi:hypothetical protein